MMGAAVYSDEWVAIDGVRLHYQEWGHRHPETVLLLHGLTQQSHAFDRVAARLAVRYRCLALDFRGRGESQWAPAETYAVRHYVGDVLGLLAALGLPAVHLLGTSLGGLVGLSLAAAAPGTLLSLGLNDIGPEIDPRGAARVASYAAAVPERFPGFDAAVAWALAQYPWLAGMGRGEATEAVRWAVREASDGTWRLKVDPAVGRAPRPSPAAAEAARRLWWDAFAGLRCPVLLVRGAESDILSAATAEEMARRQPAMLRVEVPGVGHAPTLGEPVVTAALDRFYHLWHLGRLGRLAPG